MCLCCSLESDNPLELKSKLKKLCRCAVGWLVFGVVSLAVGIVLLVFFAKYFGTSDWQIGLGYTGIAMLLLGAIIIGVCVTTCVVFNRIVNKHETRGRKFNPAKITATGGYPKSTAVTITGDTPSAPQRGTAPPPPQADGDSNQPVRVDMIEPEQKDKTF